MKSRLAANTPDGYDDRDDEDEPHDHESDTRTQVATNLRFIACYLWRSLTKSQINRLATDGNIKEYKR